MFSNHKLHKRAAISIGVMILLTMALFFFVLGSIFYNSAKITENFKSVSQLNEAYSEKQAYENTLHFRLVEVFIKSYSETLNAHSFKIADGSNFDINGDFRIRIDSLFRSLDSSNNDLIKNSFIGIEPLTFDGESIFIKMPASVKKNLSFSNTGDSKNSSSFNYSYVLESSVSFGMLGLPSFDKIADGHEKCSEITDSEENFLICLKEEFPQFNPTFNRVVPGQVHLVSKDNYYLDKKMQPFAFNLMFNSASKSSS